MQACDRNGIENSASSTFTADFMPTATSPWLPIVGFPGCSRPCLSAASTVADEALSFGWLAYLSRTSANALTACQYWSAVKALAEVRERYASHPNEDRKSTRLNSSHT